jgi:hypothetical protein
MPTGRLSCRAGGGIPRPDGIGRGSRIGDPRSMRVSVYVYTVRPKPQSRRSPIRVSTASLPRLPIYLPNTLRQQARRCVFSLTPIAAVRDRLGARHDRYQRAGYRAGYPAVPLHNT